MVSTVGSGFSTDLLLAYAKVNNNAQSIPNEQTLTLRQAKLEQQTALPEGSTVSRYA